MRECTTRVARAQAAAYIARVPDDPQLLLPAPLDVSAPLGRRDAILATGRQIRDARVLKPWMRAYAEWLMLACELRPKASVRRSRAAGLARAPVGLNHLRLLEQRTDFVSYCEDLAAGPLEAARARFVSRFPEYIEAHHEALTLARGEGDYRAMAQIAEPVLDRVMPKKSEAAAAAQVTIVLTPEQLQRSTTAYAAPPLLVSVVEPPPEPEAA